MKYMGDTFISSIAQVGFPIVVAILLLVRIEAKLEKFADKIDELNANIVRLSTIIDQMTKGK